METKATRTISRKTKVEEIEVRAQCPVTVRKRTTSVVVTIPKEIVRLYRIEVGDILMLEIIRILRARKR